MIVARPLLVVVGANYIGVSCWLRVAGQSPWNLDSRMEACLASVPTVEFGLPAFVQFMVGNLRSLAPRGSIAQHPFGL